MDADDPLLPLPDGTGWFGPRPPGVDPEQHLAHQVFDFINFNAIAWPAKNPAGELVPPPDEHVLDHLARTNNLVDDDIASVRPSASTVAVMSRAPDCDLCSDGTPARYDARLDVDGEKTTAWACPACYDQYGGGTLGASGDYYVMLLSEVPEAVRAVCLQLTSRLGRDPLW